MAVPVVKTPDPETDALDAIRRGDLSRALTILMETYGDDIYRHCRSVVGSGDLADEVHQTVFIQAFRDLATYHGRSSLRSWLYAIARHRCLDALKITRRWRRRFLAGPSVPEGEDQGAGAEARLVARADERALEAALAKLKPKVRVAVLLRFQDGMSFEDMAEICGERAATLQARVMRALPVLKEALEEMERKP
jgi:RNA polymerase sigma-70 factor (ECF subfamily)